MYYFLTYTICNTKTHEFSYEFLELKSAIIGIYPLSHPKSKGFFLLF